MSEENTNDVVPAVLAEGEAVIPTDKVEEFKAVVEDILATAEVVEEVALEVIEEPTVVAAEEVVDQNVISSGSKRTNTPSDLAAGLTDVAGGVIGTGTVKRKPAVKPVAKKGTDRVALHSTRNVSWTGVGKVLKGINIVSQEHADKWLTRDHIRLVTPDEVSKEYGQ